MPCFFGSLGRMAQMLALSLIVEWRNLITDEKLHWSYVKLKPRSLQIAWPLLQERKTIAQPNPLWNMIKT